MNSLPKQSLVAVMTAALLSSASLMSQQVEASAASAALNETKLPFDEWIYSRHIEGVGLVLIGRDQVASKDRGNEAEVYGHPLRMYADDSPPIGKLYHPVLRFSDGSRPVIVARLQDRLDVSESEPQAATYQWISDDLAGEFWNLDAALVLDAYFPGIGALFRYDADVSAFHLRLGYSWDKSTATDAEVDQREFFFGAAFHPIPRQETIGRLQHSQMNFGFLYAEDAVADAHQWTLNLNFHPVIPLAKNKTWVIGEKMTIKEFLGKNQLLQGEEKKAALADKGSGKSNLESDDPFVYFKPNISLDALLDDFTEDGAVDFEDYSMTYGTRLGVSFLKKKVELSYSLAGTSPIDDFGDNHVFHEARLQIRPSKRLSTFNITAKYTHGERAPSFAEEDRVTLAVGLQF